MYALRGLWTVVEGHLGAGFCEQSLLSSFRDNALSEANQELNSGRQNKVVVLGASREVGSGFSHDRKTLIPRVTF